MAGKAVTDDIKSAFETQAVLFQEKINTLETTVLFLKEALQQKDIETAYLLEQIANYKKIIYGPRSEKSIFVDPMQLKLFDEATTENAREASVKESKTVHVPAHERRPKRNQEEIHANLPHRETVIDLPESEKVDANGNPLVYVGKKIIRSTICHSPAEHWIEDTYCKEYKSVSPDSDDLVFVTPDIPAPLIEHSYASASIVSYIIMSKYFAGLPLYRQEQIFRQQGIELSRNTMANWVIKVSELYLEKIYLRLCRLIVQQPVIHSDETPVQVLKEPGRRPQQKSYMWVYSTSKRSDIQIRCFSYENSRSGDCANRFLKDFTGILVSDGYGGYLKVEVIRAGCWAHMRRKWVDAIPKGVSSENSNAAIGLNYCNLLFEFERGIEHLSDDERRIERLRTHENKKGQTDQEKEPLSAREILQAYWKWIDSLGANITGKLKVAVGYALNQKKYLETFLEHGNVDISNNQVENAIRPFVIGRKGWLFSDTVKGARASALIYSLIETAKANNIKPGDWLNHVLSVLPDRFAYDPNDCIDDLLPWADGMQTKFKLDK